MNDTKWDKLRLSMHDLGPLSPAWRTLDAEHGYLSPWNGDWLYHFRAGGYRTVQWLEIAIDSEEQRKAVLHKLEKIHVPGEVTNRGFRVFGYIKDGQSVNYLRLSDTQSDANAFCVNRRSR